MEANVFMEKGIRPTPIYIVFTLLVLFAILNPACTVQTESPAPPPEVTPTPSPPSSSPPSVPPSSAPPSAVNWSADGIITNGEYDKNKTYDDFSIHWSSDGEYVYIAMKANTEGWLAMALQPGQRMKDADIMLGFVKDGEATIYDQFSTGNFGPHSADGELGGTNDISEFGGQEEAGFTTIEFKRKLDTGDKYDHAFAAGVNKIIWAWGTDDNQSLKHSKRGYGEIDI